ncbi:MAG: outer-membrane lipoprotein carrier protein LolA [Rhizobiaceae bacterium]|nr:outer-membrane lipoprotein carrier protein LolA [Rhizobiaceae bacterium]
MQTRIFNSKIGPSVGAFLLAIGFSLAGNVIVSAQAATEAETLEAISKQFTAVPTMMGEFVQFGPNGEQSGGTFYIQRPGKIRFNYEEPSPIRIISNGRTVAVNNKKLKTWNFYPLSKTPLKLLLDDKLDLNDSSITSVKTEDDITTIVMSNKKAFGKSEITLLFDPASFDLRQWTIKDAQGKETSVMVFNVEKGMEIPKKYFIVDKDAILSRSSVGQNR